MPEVYRRDGSPFWYFDYAVPGGKRVRKSTKRTNKREAVQVAEAQSRRLADEAQITGKTCTLEAALDGYVSLLEVQRKPSVRNVRARFAKTLGTAKGWSGFSLAGSMLLHRLTTAHVTQLHTARLTEGASMQTANHEAKDIRAAFRHAKALGYKVGDVTFKLGKTVAKTRDLSWDEFMAVYACLDPNKPLETRSAVKTWTPTPDAVTFKQRQDVQDLMVALVMTGGRWSEVATLTWDQIDLGRATVRLFGWKDQEERHVPIPTLFREVLERRQASRSNRTLLVFPGRDGKRRAQPTQAIVKAMDACGLNADHLVARHGRATIHSLRHTYACWLLQRGLALAEVQDLLGHASPEMTQRYARYAKGQVVSRAAEALNMTPA